MTTPAIQTSPNDSGLNTRYIWTISLAAALGGLLFGYDWVVISGADLFYEKFFHLTSSYQVGWAKSAALVGCLLGAVLSGGLSDRFGRKRLLLLAAALFTVSSVGTGLANVFPVFVAWRIVGGMAIGLASNLSPMYIAEVAPAGMRGKLVSANQLTIVIGILSAQLSNYLIARPLAPGVTAEEILSSWNGQVGWRWMFAATAVPAVLFLVAVIFVPESPRWLAKKGKHGKARAVLARIGGGAYAEASLAGIEETLVGESGKVNFRALLDRRLGRVLFLGVALAILQQWCGINVIFYYAKDVFSASGFAVSDVLLNIVIIGTANLVFTVVAMRTVDRLGRRPLMLFGYAGLAVLFLLLGLGFQVQSRGLHMLALVVLAIGCYGLTLAPITWVLISEIFPNRIRGAAVSVATTALWTACFLLTVTFPALNEKLGPAKTFWIYAAICVLGFVLFKRRLPETKGKTLEALEKELAG